MASSSTSRASIPYKQHSTAAALARRPAPRDATRASHAPDVAHKAAHTNSNTTSTPSTSTSAATTAVGAGDFIAVDFAAADKVDSPARTAASKAKAGAHARLASLGRLRSRGSVPQQHPQRPQPASQSQGETTALVSPSDAGSHPKLSDASTLSNGSSATSLSDDAKSEKKSIEEKPSRPSFWLASGNLPGDSTKADNDDCVEEDQYQRLALRARMMHQTSSKLLRMTDDERPFTRVRCYTFFLHTYIADARNQSVYFRHCSWVDGVGNHGINVLQATVVAQWHSNIYHEEEKTQ